MQEGDREAEQRAYRKTIKFSQYGLIFYQWKNRCYALINIWLENNSKPLRLYIYNNPLVRFLISSLR